jgi:hypothetical protein
MQVIRTELLKEGFALVKEKAGVVGYTWQAAMGTQKGNVRKRRQCSMLLLPQVLALAMAV